MTDPIQAVSSNHSVKENEVPKKTTWLGRVWSLITNSFLAKLIYRIFHSIFSKTKSEELPKELPPPAPKEEEKKPMEVKKTEEIVKPTREEIVLKQVLPAIVDVPDDGNCFFYALSLGLWVHAQSKLSEKQFKSWEKVFTKIDGQFKDGYKENEKKALINGLTPIAKNLREETADRITDRLEKAGYLGKQKSGVDELAELMLNDIEKDGIVQHNAKTQKEINDSNSLLLTLSTNMSLILSFNAKLLMNREEINPEALKEDLEEGTFIVELMNEVNSTHPLAEIKKKIDNNKALNKNDIDFLLSWTKRLVEQQQKLVDDSKGLEEDVERLMKRVIDQSNKVDALKKYLTLSKELNFHGGSSQMMEICDQYGVTIVVWKPGKGKTIKVIDGKSCVPITFGEGEGRPVINIAHVNNGLHFKYVSS